MPIVKVMKEKRIEKRRNEKKKKKSGQKKNVGAENCYHRKGPEIDFVEGLLNDFIIIFFSSEKMLFFSTI